MKNQKNNNQSILKANHPQRMILRRGEKLKLKAKNKGYITLISVLLVSAVGLAIAVSLLTLGTRYSKSIFILEGSQMAKGYAQACSEEALQQIRDSQEFSGIGSLDFDEGNCIFEVEKQTGQNRIIKSEGESRKAKRKIKIIIDAIDPVIHIASWQEVADF